MFKLHLFVELIFSLYKNTLKNCIYVFHLLLLGANRGSPDDDVQNSNLKQMEKQISNSV